MPYGDPCADALTPTQEKVRMLAEMWSRSGGDTVIYTGAGLSTASGREGWLKQELALGASSGLGWFRTLGENFDNPRYRGLGRNRALFGSSRFISVQDNDLKSGILRLGCRPWTYVHTKYCFWLHVVVCVDQGQGVL